MMVYMTGKNAVLKQAGYVTLDGMDDPLHCPSAMWEAADMAME